MSEYGWLAAGLVAAGSAVAICWGYVKTVWLYLSGILIVRVTVTGQLCNALRMYCRQNSRHTTFSWRSYMSTDVFVRPVKRRQTVAAETLSNTFQLCWYKHRPIWMVVTPVKNGDSLFDGLEWHNNSLEVRYIRGTVCIDQLISAALEAFNALMQAADGSSARYDVKHVFGTVGKPLDLCTNMPRNAQSTAGVQVDNVNTRRVLLQHRLVTWKPDEIGVPVAVAGTALSYLALSPAAADLVQEAKCWIRSEDWYRARGIPWRRGWVLHGQPGTGKTSLVRALGEDLDMPIWVFHLVTLHDDEFQKAWKDMLCNIPCIALIEDIDSVFDGRVSKTNSVTFDCLLNCIDGVDRADGLLLVITTNCKDKLDPALCDTESSTASRPGRIDTVVEFGALDKPGRKQLCEQILHEWPSVWEKIVADGDGDTGAQFQERCTKLALELYWKAENRHIGRQVPMEITKEEIEYETSRT